jgi:hypothetical protein
MNAPAPNATFPSLEPLANIVCQLELQRGMTPVLVSDPRIVLADAFYVELCKAVSEKSGRPVRLDFLPGHQLAWSGTPRAASVCGPWLPASIASMIFSPLRSRFLKRLGKKLPVRSRLEATVAVARPGGALRELVIGLAGPKDELPKFARPISLDLGLMA